MNFYRPVLRYWKTLSALAIILILCLIPSKELARIDLLKFNFEDLVFHLVMFIAFSALLYQDLLKNSKITQKPSILLVSVMSLSLFLGITTEFLQYVLVALNRSASITDFIFDFVGASLGITYMRFIRR